MLSIRDTAVAAGSALTAFALLAGATLPVCAAPVSLNRALPTAVRGAWNKAFAVLHAFGGADGSNPQGALDLSIASSGNGTFTRTIYGTTLSGGVTSEGTIYSEVTNSGAFATLHSLAGPTEGSAPTGGLASNGTDYFPAGFIQLGVNNFGGTAFFGTVFATSATGQVAVLHAFSGNADGGNPDGRITQFTDGNFYGTTSSGANGYGTIFRITPRGGFSTVYTFTGGIDGGSPVAGLSLRVNLSPRGPWAIKNAGPSDALQEIRALSKPRFVSPYLYGTTSGADGSAGTIFRFNPATDKLQTIHAFTGGNDGGSPAAELSFDLSGDLFGTASTGGANGDGVVFALNASNKFVVVHTFKGSDGATPLAPITVAFDGNFYGTTSAGGSRNNGTVFRLANGARPFAVLHDFSGGADGANPAGKLLDGLDGNLYGTAQNGGLNGMGVLFSLPG